MTTKRTHSVTIDISLKESFDLRSTIPFSNFIEGAMRLSQTWDTEKWNQFVLKFIRK